MEAKIDEINACLYDPECYQEKGLNVLTQELAEIQEQYDKLSDRYLEILEIQEELEGNE